MSPARASYTSSIHLPLVSCAISPLSLVLGSARNGEPIAFPAACGKGDATTAGYPKSSHVTAVVEVAAQWRGWGLRKAERARLYLQDHSCPFVISSKSQKNQGLRTKV